MHLAGIRQVDSVVEAIEENGLGHAAGNGVVCVAEGSGIGVGALLLADELHVKAVSAIPQFQYANVVLLLGVGAVLQPQHVCHADGRCLWS
jgi:hypothetical protein